MNFLVFFSFIVLVFSIIIHEYMHAWMANELGDATAKDAGRLSLNPFVHIDLVGSIFLPLALFLGTSGSFVFGYAKPVPFNPFNLSDAKYGPAKVAAAGPLTNIIMAIGFGLVLRFMPQWNPILFSLLQIIVQINLILAVINLIPVPSLDGSKIIFPFLPKNIQDAYIRLERYGNIFVVIVFIILFPILARIINFLYFAIVGN